MRTEELIDQLSSEVERMSAAAALRRPALGLLFGTAAAAILLLSLLGVPARAVGATGIPAFAMKLLFTMSMVATAGILLFASGKPGKEPGRRLYWLLAPPLVVAVAAGMELAHLPPVMREAAWLGSTWQTCLLGVSILSLPTLVGIAWGFKYLAPTQLRLAGLLAGLTSGSTAAFLYAFYCPETTATFLLSWYTLGILTAGVVGGLVGPRLLRW